MNKNERFVLVLEVSEESCLIQINILRGEATSADNIVRFC